MDVISCVAATCMMMNKRILCFALPLLFVDFFHLSVLRFYYYGYGETTTRNNKERTRRFLKKGTPFTTKKCFEIMRNRQVTFLSKNQGTNANFT